MLPDLAETIALEALGWLAGENEHLEAFMQLTGADREALLLGASDPVFLGAVLDFVLENDQRVIAFCDHAGHGYDAPARARQLLPGGANIHWT